MVESHKKSILKALSWRIWGTIISWISTYYVTGSIEISTEVSIIEVLFKTFLYYFHERFWLLKKISFSKYNFFKRRSHQNA
jgi:uncharacterized membrane protein